MRKSVYISLALTCFMFCSLCASVSAQDTVTTIEKTRFGIHSAGISISWYNPSMSYWKNTYFQNNKWENKFKGALNYSAFLEVNLVRNLRVRVGGTYWNETVKSGPILIGMETGTGKLTTSLTTISIDVLYNLWFIAFEKFRPYAGLGGGFVFVQNKFIRLPAGFPENKITLQGQDYTGNVTVGIERPIVAGFTAAIEFKYVLGNYLQGVKDATGIITNQKVSLSGPQIGLNLYWVF